MFGAGLIVEHDRDLLRAVMAVMRRCGTTHIVMGIPHLHRRLGIPQRSLVDRIVALAPTLQIALVGDPVPASADSSQRPDTTRAGR